jgi:hypothetical protein
MALAYGFGVWLRYCRDRCFDDYAVLLRSWLWQAAKICVLCITIAVKLQQVMSPVPGGASSPVLVHQMLISIPLDAGF